MADGRPADEQPEGRKRLVMVTGVQRSGTTAVFEALSTSPGVTPRHEAADDEIYDDYFLRPEPQIRNLLHALPGTVLLKPVRETERRSLEAIATEYADYDLQVIWLYRDPVNVFSSYVRRGWATESPVIVAMFADRWSVRNETALSAAAALGNRIMIASYEDLCSDPALLPQLAALVGLSACATLRSDSQGGRQNLPSNIQAEVDAMTRDVTLKLAVARAVRPTRADTSRIPVTISPQPTSSPHTASVALREEYAELLRAPDLASVYRKWHASPPKRRSFEDRGSLVAIGYEESLLILSKSNPPDCFSRTDRFPDAYHAGFERLFAYARPSWNESVRNLVRKRVEEQSSDQPFMLLALLLSVVPEVNAVWMGYPAPFLDRICVGMTSFTGSQTGNELPNALAAAVEEMKATGLLRQLLDKSMLSTTDVPAFIHDTAVRTYLLATVVTNSLLIASQNPPVLEELRESPSNIPRFLVEALRLMPSFVGVRRRCNEPVRVSSLDLPTGATMDIIVGAANRDPSAFPDPDRCRLDRKGPLPIMLETATANYLRLRDDVPWPAGSLMLDTAATTLEALIAGDRPLRIMSEPRSLLAPWPDGSFIAVPGEMLIALGS